MAIFKNNKHMINIPIIVFMTLVVVCLAQIFWWIYYQVQQNTVVFQLHQAVLSIRVQKAVYEINQAYEQLVLHHTGIHSEELQAQKGLMIPESLKSDRSLNTFYCFNDTVYYKDVGGKILKLTVDYLELRNWLKQSHPELVLEKLPRTNSMSYQFGPSRVVKLPIIIRPKTEFLDDLIDRTERKTIMFISEGVFFTLMVLGGVYIMLILLKKELKLESQQKNFILSITHELKSPLAAIKLYLQTLLSKPVPPEKQSQFFSHSLYDVERLERLVENVLEAARLERGEFHYDMKPIIPSEVLKPSIQKIRSYAEDEEIDLSINIDEKAEVLGDSHAMLSVFNNLIENAVKYSLSPKRISIRLYQDSKYVYFEIEDNGPGIDKNDIPYIFDRFYRAGNEMTRNTKGTGIGLYLVKKITEAHKGQVSVRSAESGQGGALFQIRLPKINKL
jgi:signal transduction histidine kinase